MNYKTSKQLAKEWGISAKRITVLAKEGKIDGATLIGKTWAFPFDVVKPEDRRYKRNKPTIQGKFIFPLFIYSNLTDDFIAQLNSEQKEFLDAELSFNKCQISNSQSKFIKILEKTNDIMIKMACYYYLAFCYLIKEDYKNVRNSYEQLKEIISMDFEHKNEVCYLINDVANICKGKLFFDLDFDTSKLENFDDSSGAYVFVWCFYSAVIKRLTKQESLDLNIYNLVVQKFEKNGFVYPCIHMHIYLAIMYKLDENERSCYEHFKKAIDLIVKCNYFIPLLTVYTFLNKTIDTILDEYPCEIKERLALISGHYLKSINGLAQYKSNAPLPKLTLLEFRYIGFAISGLSNKRIAIAMRVNESTVSKKYSVIFDKLGVYKKEEMISHFKHGVPNPYLMSFQNK